MEGIPKVTLNESEKPDSETPEFIKEFSRVESEDDRNKTATAIREKRRERDVWRSEHTELIAEQENLVTELNGLQEKIEGYNSAGFLQKITDYFEYRELQANVIEQQTAHGEIEQLLLEKEQTPPQFEEPRRILEEFYDGEEKKWSEAGYSKEDMQVYLSEENLSKLSLDEYALLMRRFPGEMVTHVTRQGIRDHSSSLWHTAGMGKAVNGFKDMLSSGKLQSALGITMQEHTKEVAMEKFLHLDTIDGKDQESGSSREKALLMHAQKFDSNLATNDAYADSAAVHVASESVMDAMYGSEKGNEIFIAYPSAHVASQYYYGGKGDLNDSRVDQHNDKWIYTKDQEGMSLDSGLVFIPDDAVVDVETGSRYKVAENGEPIIPQRRIDEICNARFEKTGFIQTFVQQLPGQLEQFAEEEKTLVTESAFKEFGITDLEAKKALLNPKFLEVIGSIWGSDTERDEYSTAVGEYFLEHAGNRYELAEKTISSREYWEEYFAEYPEQRPSKVVYYSGGDPSRALTEWRRENGIVKRTEDGTYGFQEHRVAGDSSEANQGKERLQELALKIIDDRFPDTTNHNEESNLVL